MAASTPATASAPPSSSSTAEQRPTLPSLRTLDLPLPFPLKSMSANANVRLGGPGQPAISHDAHDASNADAVPAYLYPTCYTRPHPWQRQLAQHGRHPYRPCINARRESGSSSRTASPSPPPPPIAARRPSSYPGEITHLTSRTPSPYFPGPHFRLVPSTFAEADAVVVYPHPEGPHIPELEEVIRRAAPVAETDATPAVTPLTTGGSRHNQDRGRGAAAGAQMPGRGKAFLVVGPVLDALRGPDRKIAKGARVRPYRMVPLPFPPSLRRLSTVSTASS